MLVGKPLIDLSDENPPPVQYHRPSLLCTEHLVQTPHTSNELTYTKLSAYMNVYYSMMQL